MAAKRAATGSTGKREARLTDAGLNRAGIGRGRWPGAGQERSRHQPWRRVRSRRAFRDVAPERVVSLGSEPAPASVSEFVNQPERYAISRTAHLSRTGAPERNWVVLSKVAAVWLIAAAGLAWFWSV